MFYHDRGSYGRGNYGRGKYGGISPKPPIFLPVIILPVISASQNVSYISREFTRFLLSQMHLSAL